MSTLKIIAERAGVSVKTVSNVLNGKNKEVWPSTKERAVEIRKIAAELNYVPHGSARTMRTGRFGVVALLAGLESNQIPGALIHGLHHNLSRHDLMLAFASIGKKELIDVEQAPRIFREQCVDGLLVRHVLDIPKAVRDRISKMGLAAVWIDTKAKYDAVYPDDFTAGKNLAETLIRGGYGDVGFLLTHVERASYESYTWQHGVRDRTEGYSAAMIEAGLPPKVFMPEMRLIGNENYGFIERILSSNDCPRALITYNFELASITVAVAARLKKRVPGDLQVACFISEDFPRHALPVTMMPVPWYQIGKAAVEMLMKKMENPNVKLPSRVIPYSLDPRVPG